MEVWANYNNQRMRSVFRVYDPLRDCLQCATDDETGLKNDLEKYLPSHCAFFDRPKSEHDLRIVAEILAISSRKDLADLTFVTVDRRLEKAVGTVMPAMISDHPGKVAWIKCQLLRRGS